MSTFITGPLTQSIHDQCLTIENMNELMYNIPLMGDNLQVKVKDSV